MTSNQQVKPEEPAQCERCKEWQRMCLSDTCPDCDMIDLEHQEKKGE